MTDTTPPTHTIEHIDCPCGSSRRIRVAVPTWDHMHEGADVMGCCGEHWHYRYADFVERFMTSDPVLMHTRGLIAFA